MTHIFRQLAILIVGMGTAGLLMGCGSMEADPPISKGEDGDDRSSSQQEATATQGYEEVHHPFEDGDDDDGEEQHEGGDDAVSGDNEHRGDDVDDHPCAPVCVKTLWCQEDEESIEQCVEPCEESRYNGIVSESVFQCLEDAEGCTDVTACESLIEPCAEICGVYNQCGIFDDGAECQAWCAGEIWAGRLDWDVQGCIGQAGRADACGDLAECGLSKPGD